MRRPAKRDLDRRLDDLENENGGPDDFEIVIRNEVIETGWEPDKGEAPEAGSSTTRYYYDENGEWASEDIS